MHIATELCRADGGLPLPGLGPGIELGNAAGAAHEQSETEVGGAFGQYVGGVGQGNATRIEVVQVVVVVAHRHTRHHFQLAGVGQLRLTKLATHTDQAVGLGQGLVELGTDIAELGVRHDHVEVLLQAFDHRRGDAAEGKDGLFHRRNLCGRWRMGSTLSFSTACVQQDFSWRSAARGS
ncbi:hypothetical protein D3C84_785530 [compost metagenome]